MRDRLELVLRETSAADAVAIDLRGHRDEPLHELELAHLHREHSAGLSKDDRGVLHEAQREARLAETGATREEDEIRWLEPARLGVERGNAGRHADVLIVAPLRDLIRVSLQRDVEGDDVAVQARLVDREEQGLRLIDRAL